MTDSLKKRIDLRDAEKLHNEKSDPHEVDRSFFVGCILLFVQPIGASGIGVGASVAAGASVITGISGVAGSGVAGSGVTGSGVAGTGVVGTMVGVSGTGVTTDGVVTSGTGVITVIGGCVGVGEGDRDGEGEGMGPTRLEPLNAL